MANKVLACVTQQKTCERLIKKAYELKDNDGELYVLNVVRTNNKFLNNDKEGEALDYLFKISKNYDAYMSVLRADRIKQTICDYVIDNSIDIIVIGESPDSDSDNTFYKKLSDMLINHTVEIVTA